MSRHLLLLLLLGMFAACNRRHHTVTRGYYYWRTNYILNAYERQRLQAVQAGSLYLHCFDIDWDEAGRRPHPLAVVRFLSPPDSTLVYTPVVFITQKTMARISPAQTARLAADISRLLDGLLQQHRLPVHELQIDCDWTRSTRAAYFALLTALRAQPLLQHKTLSCTIRLHQVKFRTGSGIPPVDKGLLMCYNLGDLKRPGAHNSILDAGLAGDYLANLQTYPLPLDVALPLFSWCVQFRGGRMAGILRDVSPGQLMAGPLFDSTGRNLFRCRTDTVWNGYPLKAGDEIRTEAPDQAELNAVAAFTAANLRRDSLTVLFFHADSLTLSHYTNHELEAIYHNYD